MRREKKLEPASSETGRSVTLKRRKRRRGWKGREREEAREVGRELWGGIQGTSIRGLHFCIWPPGPDVDTHDTSSSVPG